MTEEELPKINVVDARTGEAPQMDVLEEHDIAFDPSRMHLDLLKEEKRRMTALMMAVQAYKELIIKDADYLREAHNQARSNNGPAIQPATIDAMVEAAIKFDMFIAGEFTAPDGQTRGGSQAEAVIPEGES